MSKIDSGHNFCVPRFDKFFSADIDINCICPDKYHIIFCKMDQLTVYQVWGSEGGKRIIFDIDPEEWVKFFNKNIIKPTATVNLDDKKYAFVLEEASYSSRKMCWIVSTKLIKNESTTFSNGLKTGKFSKAQFDVDDLTYVQDLIKIYGQRSYVDQRFCANIKIEEKGTNEYIITFSSIGILTFIQTYISNCSPRLIFNENLKYFIHLFNKNLPFEPTTLMQIELENYAFILQKIEIFRDQMVWHVSSNDLKNLSQNVKKELPIGNYYNVKFNVNNESAEEKNYGITGPTGPRGKQGPQGKDGVRGKDGATGPTGEAGHTGATGLGETGPTGAAGPTGQTGSPGATGPTGQAGAGGVVSYWGSFWSTQDQTIDQSPDNPYPATLNSSDPNNFGVVLVGATPTSLVSVPVTGVYNIQFSAQIQDTTSGGSANKVNIWLRINGSDVPETNTFVSMDNQNSYVVAAWNFLLKLNANDQIELVFYTTDTGIQLTSDNSLSPGQPNVPSLIFTVQQVTFSGPTGATGETGPTGATGVTGATGPTGSLGVTGTFYSDYIFWNSNTVSWDVGNSTLHLGSFAGETGNGIETVALGYNAGGYNQSDYAIAVGSSAGQTGQGNKSISIGNLAGNETQGDFAVAIGYSAGKTSQRVNAIGIGPNAGYDNQKENAIAIGNSAGENSQGIHSVSIGYLTARYNQGDYSVAIGPSAGFTGQVDESIAIGINAGYDTQGSNAIAIGQNAGYTGQGENSIAIGKGAGVTGQPANSIILNASGTSITPGTTGFFVNPVRGITGVATPKGLYYDTTTSEIYYDTYTSSFNNYSVSTDISTNTTLSAPFFNYYQITTAGFTVGTTLDITLPTISSLPNNKSTFIICDVGGNCLNNSCIIKVQAPDIINGTTGYAINTNYASLTVTANGLAGATGRWLVN